MLGARKLRQERHSLDKDHSQASPQWAIDVRGLCKSYGGHEAIRGIELRVASGEVFALLGPNGAGKTTIVEILEGHRSRSAGQISVLGQDPGSNDRAFKQRLGIVLQSTSVDQYLSVEEAIDQFRGYYPNPLSLEELLDLVGLREERTMRVKKLSGGQQRRLDVAIGLAGDPELLFLDEPTTGFDPSAAARGMGDGEGIEVTGQDGAAHHALHGRGRVPGGSSGNTGAGEGRGGGSARRAGASRRDHRGSLPFAGRGSAATV